MTIKAAEPSSVGIDSVEIARIERLLHDTPEVDLGKLFSAQELLDSGNGRGRASSLAARFAAKEACLKLFPRETALNTLVAADFSVSRDSYGAPQVACSQAAIDAISRHRFSGIKLSLTHSATTASAVALAERAEIRVPLVGRLVYHLLPIRRRVMLGNLRRVFGTSLSEGEIIQLAQAHYAHLTNLVREFLVYPWFSKARLAALVEVQNRAAIEAAGAKDKGLLVLTGHFGNWEVSTNAGIANVPDVRGRFFFLRRPLKPRWFENLVIQRSRRAGLETLPHRGSLTVILDRLESGNAIVFPFDQHASGRDGVRVEFFGHPAGTLRSLAILAMSTGAPVVPAASWREPDGHHVLRFEEALPVIQCEDTNEAIRRNTLAYNAVLERLILRHPEQWWWIHRRWKD